MIPPCELRRLRPTSGSRGFTLLELMTVVVIITVLAVIAIPMVTGQMRDRRTQEAAQRVSNVYVSARMRAMGRGAAVMVRYDAGRFDVFEAQRGTGDSPVGSSAAECAALPVPSCLLTDWNGAVGGPYRLVASLDLPNRSEYDRLKIDMKNQAGSAVTTLDVCFTPMGRAFSRTATDAPLNQLAQTHVAEVYRGEASNRIGRLREVLLLPNGTARLSL